MISTIIGWGRNQRDLDIKILAFLSVEIAMHAFYQEPVLSIETFILRIGSGETFWKKGLILIKF